MKPPTPPLRLLVLALASALNGACMPDQQAIDPTELSADTLKAELAEGSLTAVEVTSAYLDRIEAMNHRGPELHAILELNPDARADAAALDELFARSGPIGPLHGVPIVIKGNISVRNLVNSAGSLALETDTATADAPLTAAIREAGAVILGTANLSEWANFRDSRSSSGWSSLGGQTRNPHVLDRNPCGSSSGSAVAVAATLAPLAVGTETNGSIVCPAGVNGVVGIKPTLGLVSRTGIIPISHTQDTAGPMAGSVAGAALLLEVMRGHDPSDPGSVERELLPLVPDPDTAGLAGVRIGVLRTYRGAGRFPRVEAVYQEAVDRLRVLGAELVDPIAYEPPPVMRSASFRILLREFKAGLNRYLAERRGPMEDLAAIIRFNDEHRFRVMPIFDQDLFRQAEAMTGLDDPAYQEDLNAAQVKLREDVDGLFAEHDLDALFLPVNGPAWKTDWVNGDQSDYGGTASLAAITGYPSIVLPAGTVDHLPIAVGFVGRPFEEAALIRFAYGLEQSLPAAPRPEFIPTLETPAIDRAPDR